MAASLWLPQPQLPLGSSHFLPSSHSCSPPAKNKKHAASGRGGSFSSSVVTKQQEEAAAASEEASQPAALSYKDDPNFRGCKGCGREQVERGCNSEGRIQGGIAAVPGFGWWPIKAYRPCPSFAASGGRYRRQGQSMDDVASGRGKKVSSAKNKR